MSLQCKKTVILFSCGLILSACGGTANTKPMEPVEVTPVVVAPPPPPPEPVAQTLAIGARDNQFSVERLSTRQAAEPQMQIEYLKFDASEDMQLASVEAEPAGAPAGMGKRPANAEQLRALIAAKTAESQAASTPLAPSDAPVGMGKKPANSEQLKALVVAQNGVAAPQVAPANKVDIEKKLRFARMMLMTKSGRRIAESDNQDAKLILKDVAKKLDKVEALLKADDQVAADATLGEAMRLFNMAGRMVPSEDLMAKQKSEFPGLKEEIAVAKDLHQRNYDKVVTKHGLGAGVNYDKRKVAELEAEAEQQAKMEDYALANQSLSQARDMIQAAIRQMMSGRKIVYELNIDTPEGEFQHELNRYIGYEELIPIAIEQKKPTAGVKMLAMRHVNEAKRMADAARKNADEGEYPKAIRMIMDATVEIRKALKLMGVPNIG